ncbi:alpha/beta fold hydrolase [Nocardia sp. MW-W600-9]
MTGALTTGTHAFDSDGVIQRYHVYGSGPVCLVHPGGPGIHWEYLRMPALEQHLTMVYIEALGTGESGRLPNRADYWGDEPRWTAVRDALRAGYISGLDALGAPDLVDDRADLPALTVPALVVVGRFDVICGPRWAQELHDRIPDARLVVLENSGHLGHLEEPERFAEAVRDFVLPTPSLSGGETTGGSRS